MSYESDCADYAVNGNPMQDHYDYEENARYDMWDGHRGDAALMGQSEYEAERDYEDFLAHQDRVGWEASFSDADCADHADYLDELDRIEIAFGEALDAIAELDPRNGYDECDVRSGESYNLPHTD